MQETFKTNVHHADFCVVGGGMAGICAAVAAARHGLKTILMHERPVLGGNASSEIRMWISGSSKFLETGIVEEIRLENLYRNNYPNFSVWDSILYEKVKFQENLTCLLNCTCQSLKMDGNKIASVTGWQMTTEEYHEVHADYFADCSGDSVLAPLSGAVYRIGREDKKEFDESLAQENPDRLTMGLSCLLQVRETDSPQKFIPPSWANKYPDDSSFPKRYHMVAGDRGQNFWWIELGGDQDSIHDTEKIRDELIKTVFGLWDHIKNHGDHGVENWVIDWIGFLPGKRESRRIMGDYILSQKDILSGGHFPDTIAYGGWPIDDHHPGGFRHFGPANLNIYPDDPYGIPARCIYSVNIDNLLFAGRNISTTHTGLSSTRVMATCSTLGQAVGTIAAFAKKNHLTPRETVRQYIHDIQQTLLRDDCTLPGFQREIAPLSQNATLTSSCGNAEVLRDGWDRPQLHDSTEHAWICNIGDTVEYRFDKPQKISGVRLVFDSNLARSENWIDHLNMISNYPKNMPHFQPPETLIKGFKILVNGKEVFHTDNNYQRLRVIPLDLDQVETVQFVAEEFYTPGEKKLFAFEVY